MRSRFDLGSGPPAALLALADRWCKRFGLIVEPRDTAEQGDRLAQGTPTPPLRKASGPIYANQATAVEAFGSVLDECLSQIIRNGIGLVDGDPDLRVEHVHQLRVGIRRLRSALRSFDGWVPPVPERLIEALRALFATLGASRDSDVLDSGVAAALREVGAPPLAKVASSAGPDPAETVRRVETQRLLIAWAGWRACLTAAQGAPSPVLPPADAGSAEPAPEAAQSGTEVAPAETPPPLGWRAERRLRKWHRLIVGDWKAFDALDEAALHALRKRIKRQRYAVEFFAPLLSRKQVNGYLRPLGLIQDRMGELNDLYVARSHYQSLLESDPAAWFALGWLAARIEQVRTLAKPELGRLAKADSPRCSLP